jgi:hypothetical protein
MMMRQNAISMSEWLASRVLARRRRKDPFDSLRSLRDR